MKPFVALLFVVFLACASAQPDLRRISIGMSKAEVMQALGQPRNIVGAKKYEDGIVEVLAYGEDTNALWDGRPGPAGVAYHLYFWNGELVQWAPAKGGWEAEADRVYELRMR